MRFIKTGLTVLSTLVACAGTAVAQDEPMQHQGSGSISAIELPDACRAGEPAPADGMGGMMSGMEAMGEHQRALMQGMMETQELMMQGVMADDPDVAFACGMIPHHQAAINMAEVELEHGDDEQMQQMAQAIIDAQKKEIEELTSWIEEQAR